MKTKLSKTLVISMLVILGWNNKTNSQSQWTQTTTPPGGSIWAMETIGA